MQMTFGRLNWQLWVVTFLLVGSQPAWAGKKELQMQKYFSSTKAADLLVQQPSNLAVEITAVKITQTTTGIEVILGTKNAESLQVINKSDTKNFIVEIPNSQLRLTNGNSFREEKPFAGITEVLVVNQDSNTVRVTVTSEAGIPTVELFDGDEGLILGLTPAATAMQPQPQPDKPANETPQEEPIELMVTGEQDGYRVQNATTATRTDTPLRDIPQSIQVVPQTVLREQRATRLGDALRNVSGVNATRGSGDRADSFVIRGFEISSGNVLNNGLPDRTLTETRDLYNRHLRK
jgi:iron complex outermembrane receptor protein